MNNVRTRFLALISLCCFFTAAGCADSQVLTPSIGVVSIQQQPVMSVTDGDWDGIDVANPSIFLWKGVYVNFYSGWNGTIWQTGVATSHDGIMWNKEPTPVNPVLTPGSNAQWSTQYIAANGSAILFNGQVYHYFHGEDAGSATRIGLSTATTANMTYQTALPNAVVNPGQPGAYDDLGVADPYVVKVGSQLWMYYLAYDHNYVFTIARAVSSDGVNWTKDPAGEIFSGASTDFDSDGAGEPCVFWNEGYWYMIYTGNHITTVNGVQQSYRSLMWAWSHDGQHWSKGGLLMPQSYRPFWASQAMADATVLPTGNNDGTFYLWFLGGDIAQPAQGMNGRIGMMTIHVTGNGP